MTCTVDASGELLTVRGFPDGGRSVSLTRRHQNVGAEVTGATVDEAELRRVLDALHPLSDAELEGLIRDKRTVYRI
ncbi:hypothetical protein ACFRMQ_14715 [Kitasatospora sp. NPDC056783]|uniref:hypothetical protein n=1 Tax=Kitasatospora sp. NPDC056783 TaxID=3345943 RepID=UPI0036C8BB32